jgi:hypothetical protein
MDENIEKIQSQVLQDVSEFHKKVSEAVISSEHLWFRNLILGILTCALADYKSVEIGIKKSAYLAAWGKRNLLELKVITEYVLASEGNALAFKNELLIDAKEFYEAISKHHAALHAQLLNGLRELAGQQPDGPRGDCPTRSR